MQQFIELYTKHQKKIYLYILSMVHQRSDADDLMQQTASDMWKMFGRFEQGGNFVLWGIAIARYRILEFRRQRKRQGVFLSEEVYEQIVQELPKISQAEKRIDALRGCLTKLKDTDSKLLTLHYEQGLTYKDVSQKLGRSSLGIYKVMARIHKDLYDCVNRTIVLWETNI